ncbi:hypothetical protein RUM44_004558 [Polyplax serrata]|uniref:Testican-2 n=1 Tax=Polyplax serrata TaxID=468196 RepID=A0ABR1B368_POLSC
MIYADNYAKDHCGHYLWISLEVAETKSIGSPWMREKVSVKGRHITTRIEPRLTIDFFPLSDVIIPKSKVTEPPPKDMDDNAAEDDDDDDDDEDDDDDDDIFYDSEDGQDVEGSADSTLRCKTCPIVKPVFLCGSDNRTYSSLCRLDYHNCLHRSHVKITCKGFCPCKAEVELMFKKKQKQAERMNNLMAKFRSTMEREKANKYKSEKTSEPSKYDNLEKSYKTFKYDKYNANLKTTDKKKYQDKYSYVPEEFKYDNKHYKYIKYKKYSKDFYGADDNSHNEVIEMKPNRPTKECSPSSLQSMGNRLLDWFSVVMSESKKKKQPKVKAELPGWCKSEVRWMFGYLDLDGDEKLSLQELYHMEHDHSEKCVKPFVDGCDSDRDIFISPKEWCHCFDKTDRPCAAAKRRLSPDLIGAFVPECDGQGYFRSTQCHTSAGICWCVDKHGVELSNTRTRGKPNCEKLTEKSKDAGKKIVSEKVNIDDEDEEDEDNESDLEGSADQPLDF